MFENFSFDAPTSAVRRHQALISPPIAPETLAPLFFSPYSTPPLSPREEEDDALFKRTLSTSLSTLSIADKQVLPPTDIHQSQLPSPTSTSLPTLSIADKRAVLPTDIHQNQLPSPTSVSFFAPSVNPRTCVRFQRQILARLQTTDSQRHCLSTRVEEMVSLRDNCSVSAAPPLHGCSSPPPTTSRGRRNSLPSVVSRGSLGSGIKKPSFSSSKDRDLRLKRGSPFFSSPAFSFSKASAKNGKPSSKGLGISKKGQQQRARRGAISVAWRRSSSSSSSSSSGHVSD